MIRAWPKNGDGEEGLEFKKKLKKKKPKTK